MTGRALSAACTGRKLARRPTAGTVVAPAFANFGFVGEAKTAFPTIAAPS